MVGYNREAMANYIFRLNDLLCGSLINNYFKPYHFSGQYLLSTKPSYYQPLSLKVLFLDHL